MSLIKPFTGEEQDLINAMRATWNAIAPDALEVFEEGTATRDEVVELVCDANRLRMFGGENGLAADKLQFELCCIDFDRFKEISVAAFPQDFHC